MTNFFEWIKDYIQEKFASDGDFTKSTNVRVAYLQGNKVTTENVPQIIIQVMDDSEVDRFSSFEGENVSSIPLQFTAYTGAMKIGGQLKNAQEASMIFGTKLKKVLNELRENVVNENIVRCRRATTSPALPLINGEKVYFTAVRCDFWVAYPFAVGE